MVANANAFFFYDCTVDSTCSVITSFLLLFLTPFLSD